MPAAFERLITRIRRSVLNRLETPYPGYEQRIYNDMNRLTACIRPGDALLVEGRSEMSRIIKLFSTSHWSHVALYVGDRLIQPGAANRERILAEHGRENAGHMLVEAYSGQGVIAAPISKYQDDNIRICRPYGLLPEDRDQVIDTVIANLGDHYDDQNIIDIALMALRSVLNPANRRSITACLGNCNDFQVICSGMLAKAFQQVGYPIIPALNPAGMEKARQLKNPYGATLMMRHYSQILPRDFDLSPNFTIIKYNIIDAGEFDYRSYWHKRQI